MTSSTSKAIPAVIYFDATMRRREKMRLTASRAAKPDSANSVPHKADLNMPTVAAVATSEPDSAAPQPLTQSPAASSLTPSSVVPSSVVPEPLAVAPESTVPATGSVPNTSMIPAQIKPIATLSADHSPIDPADLSTFMVNFVVDQTGYPTDMVELDADLEADLGIDSITLAQLLGEIRDRYGVTPGGDLSLDDFVTLNQIAAIFLRAEAELIESVLPDNS